MSLDEKESGMRATLNLGHTFGHVSDCPFSFYWLLYYFMESPGKCYNLRL